MRLVNIQGDGAIKIKMYDVNFGECILYDSNSKQLLVDCGAKFCKKGLFAYSRVQNDIKDNASLMISHFDEDHYNGIIEMPDRKTFNKIYLPLYIWNNNIAGLTAQVFIDTLKTLAHLFIIGNLKLSTLQKLFNKLPNLVANLTDIKCIGASDSVSIGKYSFDVLWPEENPGILSGRSNYKYSQKLKNILVEADYMPQGEADEAVDNYVKAFVSLYNFYSMQENTVNEWNQRQRNFNYTYERLRRLRSISANVRVRLRKKHALMRQVNNISSALIRNMNSCSIVFHNNIHLACGDITKEVMSYLSQKNKLNRYYQCVKVSHHGTKAYYSPIIPKAGIYLISNSGVPRANWKIYDKYCNYNCCCTNNNNLRCCSVSKCRHCNIINQHTARIIFTDTNTYKVIK